LHYPIVIIIIPNTVFNRKWADVGEDYNI